MMNKRSTTIGLILVAVATILVALWLTRSDDSESGAGSDGSSGESARGTSGEGSSSRSGDSGEDGAINEAPDELNPDLPSDELERLMREGAQPSAEEQAELDRQAALELNNGEEPLSCETHCDCPQGQTCQPGSQLCLPSPFRVWCCDRDGCPSGAQCVHMDGSYGNCGG